VSTTRLLLQPLVGWDTLLTSHPSHLRKSIQEVGKNFYLLRYFPKLIHSHLTTVVQTHHAYKRVYHRYSESERARSLCRTLCFRVTYDTTFKRSFSSSYSHSERRTQLIHASLTQFTFDPPTIPQSEVNHIQESPDGRTA
jgi:hypothetical protein